MDQTLNGDGHILVVGGGFAGFWAAVAARRVVGDTAPITLVSSGPALQMRPRLYESDPAGLGVELAPLLDVVDVAFTIDTASHIDASTRTVTMASGLAVAYDRMVVAVGSTMRRPQVPGAERAFSVDTQHDAIVFDRHLATLAAQRSRPDPITIAVVGAGFTGIELVLELRDRLAAHDSRYGESMRLVLIDRNPEVGAGLGVGPRPAIEEAMRTAKVDLRLGLSISALSGSSVGFVDGSALAADAVVLATGMEAAPFTQQLPGVRDHLGRLVVTRSLRLSENPDVFVAGDVAAVDTGDGHIALQSCQHALQLGRVAGENAARDMLGQELVDYEQLRYVTCLDLGRSGAVLTSGWDRNVVSDGAEAKAVKRRINTAVIYPPTNPTREELLALSVPSR